MRRLGQMLMKFKRQALHAFRLNFKHPITDEMISLTSSIPDDMESMIIALSDQEIRLRSHQCILLSGVKILEYFSLLNVIYSVFTSDF